MLLIDTGASNTILKPEQYYLIPEERRPALEPCNVKLIQADGKDVEALGKAMIEVQVGSTCHLLSVIVAKVGYGILGIDFLVESGATIDCKQLQLKVGNVAVHCRTARNKAFFARVVVASDLRVPAEHEVVISACVVGEVGNGLVGLIEPVDKGPLIENGMLIARSVVKTNIHTVPARIMNPTPEEKVVKQGTMLGELILVEDDDIAMVRTVPAMCDIGIQTQSESDHTVSGDVNVEHVASIETTTKVNQGSLTVDDQKDDDGASVGFEISLDSDWMDDCVWEGGEVEVQTEDIQGCNVSNVPEITFEMIRADQLADKSISPVLSWKESKEERPSWKDVSDKTSTLKCYWSQWDSLCVKEGVLVKRWESDDGKVIKWLVVLPSGLRERVLDELHASNAAAHLGREKTLPKVRERFYWVGMSTDVAAYVRRCVMCARKKNPPRKRRAPLQQYRVGAPMERIAIDVLGPLTETNDGNVFILVVGDYFTQWMESYPIKDQQAETVAEVLVSQFVCRFGVPIDLHSDQGRNFESKVFQEMCTILGINKTRTTPYNPKSDGLVERYNRTIVNAVSLMIQPHQHQRDWDVYLPYVSMAYRSSIQASTGESPNMMMLGREVTMPVDLIVGAVPHEQECETYYTDDLREKIRDIHERARHALQLSQRRQKRNYDRSARESVFKKGKFVWLHNNQRRPRLSKKLMLPWEGPYLIVTELSDVTCRIQKTARSKPKVVHVDRLKLYEGPKLKGWEYEVTVEKEIDITLDGSAGASKEESQASCDERRVDEDVHQNPVADVGKEFNKSDKGIVDEDVRQNPEYAGKDSYIGSDKGSVDENVRRNPERTRKMPARYL